MELSQGFSIDFTGLPFKETVQLLRLIGQQLIDGLLLQREPELIQGLSAEQIGVVVSNTRYEDIAFKDTLHKALEGEITEESWRTPIMTKIGQELGMGPGYRLPEPMWTLVGLSAWGSPAYTLHIARRIESYLRRWTLVTLDPQPTITLSVRTYWLLLALSGTNLQYRIDRMFQHQKSLRDTWLVIRRMRQEGAKQGLIPGWANLWDQWLLLEAFEQWNHGRWPPELEASTGALPLRPFAEIHTRRIHTFPDHAITDLAAPGWDTAFPGWFKTWLAQGRYRLKG